VLDLFCCAGGAGAGYWYAGFDVVGVDRVDRPHYPFQFLLCDALEAMRRYGQEFDLVHASPPCQRHTALTRGTNRSRAFAGRYADFLAQMRELCLWFGVPWVIENVPGAPVRADLVLCGEMFGLAVLRHRVFEIGWPGAAAEQPVHRPHRGPVRGWRHKKWQDGPYVAAYGKGGGKASVAEMQAAMEITWTPVREELTEAIPPAYTRHISEQFIAAGGWGAAHEPDPGRRLAALARPARCTPRRAELVPLEGEVSCTFPIAPWSP
jgi:hypothetical protein